MTSVELRFLIDRHLAARGAGQHDVADVYARAVEGLLIAALPKYADAIAGVARRKGEGKSIGGALAQCLSPMAAAATFVVWSCRQARRPAVDALGQAFRGDPFFNDTIRTLCSRVSPPVGGTEAPKATLPIETAAAYRR